MEEIVQRTADAMVAEGSPFQGLLFAGLMIKDGRVRLLCPAKISGTLLITALPNLFQHILPSLTTL